MYLKHFGLERSPFKITPDTSLFYEGGNRGAALEAVKYAILQGEGIIKVVGEVGSGKTMLCRMLEIRLPEQVEIVYLANPSLSPEKILHVIAMEMKLPVEQNDDKSKVMQMLQDHLLKVHANGHQVVVFIEEAQGMPLDTLEQIRLLSNLETNHFKMLQIVLFGQPELDENLARREIRQLKERISHHFSLDVFDKKNIQSYLNFRLRAAGYKGADLFSAEHARAMAKYSQGLSRRINILADKILLAAFSEDSDHIKKKYIKLAARDSQYLTAGFALWNKYAFAGLLMLSAVAMGWFLRELGETVFAEQELALDSKVLNNKEAASHGNRNNYATFGRSESVPQRLKSNKTQILLEQRLKLTALWLKSNSDYRYSVQLMLLEDNRLQALADFLLQMQQQNLLDKIYVYTSRKNGQLYYGVLYGQFRQYSIATRSMEDISQQMKLTNPFVRDMKDISSEYI
ncbi:MAG: AAA family ATPase [Gammaproteobacteria bacterium]|nr:AAA family ATPase [Gammaproteobacteria bacterium]